MLFKRVNINEVEREMKERIEQLYDQQCKERNMLVQCDLWVEHTKLWLLINRPYGRTAHHLAYRG